MISFIFGFMGGAIFVFIGLVVIGVRRQRSKADAKIRMSEYIHTKTEKVQ